MPYVFTDAVFTKPLNVRQVDALLSYIRKEGTETTIATRTEIRPDGERGLPTVLIDVVNLF